jgi:hypothetical protein
MRGTGRRADREARGGAGTGRRSAVVGERVALGGGGGEGGAGAGRRTAAGGREARIQEGRGVLGVLLLGAFNIENAPKCILVPPCIYIYILRPASSRATPRARLIESRPCPVGRARHLLNDLIFSRMTEPITKNV